MDPQREAARLGDGREPVGGLGGQHPEVDRLDAGRRLGGIEPRQPQHVVEQPAHALRLAVDPLEGGRYQSAVALAGERQAGVCASMTESGVRSSCEASAVNSSWRWRARSIGAATRRPMATAPRKTTSSRIGAMRTSARMIVELALSDDRVERLADDDVAIADLAARDPQSAAVPMMSRSAGDRDTWARSAGRSGVSLVA